MKYIKTNQQNEFLEELPNINTVWDEDNYCTPEALIKDGKAEQFGVAEMVEVPQPEHDRITQVIEESTPILIEGVWTQQWIVTNLPMEQAEANLLAVESQVWDRIKQERDRRKYLGVKVGAHWFHSDDPSRIQQLALAMMGNAIPAGLMWKTLTLTPPPVFVAMTPALAQGIFMATAASDAAIFAAAETHRLAIEASDNPESYDCTTGWPASIEDTP